MVRKCVVLPTSLHIYLFRGIVERGTACGQTDWPETAGHTPTKTSPHSLLLYFHAKLYSVLVELIRHEMIVIAYRYMIAYRYNVYDS